MKVVPGTSGKNGLSMVVLVSNFAGSIAGAYGPGPSRLQTAPRAPCWALHVLAASFPSADAWSLHILIALASGMLPHLPRARSLSLRASAWQENSASRDVVRQTSDLACASDGQPKPAIPDSAASTSGHVNLSIGLLPSRVFRARGVP